MNEIITHYSEQATFSDTSENLLFRYYPNLPAGSMVQVGSKDNDLEKYHNGKCYEFTVDFFGEKKKLFLEQKRAIGFDEEFEVTLYEFMLHGIEDAGSADLQ
ncbi:hypothetical protein [Hufsiella ginkgonis]|uniref:Uncharacterized protein n=1 Tax=Hufsiella ginkgonis TaxID=2695274 RepID=A0A7K1XUA1_9SPHI|nr:hypothetical protein [Hufsiella ginkgonis]MXV14378.1 hypothetical protein [Hufsiella ginkgonis]